MAQFVFVGIIFSRYNPAPAEPAALATVGPSKFNVMRLEMRFHVSTMLLAITLAGASIGWLVDRANLAKEASVANSRVDVFQATLLRELQSQPIPGRPVSDVPHITTTADRVLTTESKHFDSQIRRFSTKIDQPRSDYVIYMFRFFGDPLEGDANGFNLLVRKGVILEIRVFEPIW